MKMSYHGVSYDYEPLVLETTVGEAGGKYRGLDWRFRNLKKPPVLRPTVNLTYRSVKYNKPGTITPRKVILRSCTKHYQEQKPVFCPLKPLFFVG